MHIATLQCCQMMPVLVNKGKSPVWDEGILYF